MLSTRLAVLVSCLIAGSCTAAAVTFKRDFDKAFATANPYLSGTSDKRQGADLGGVTLCTDVERNNCQHLVEPLETCINLEESYPELNNAISAVTTDSCIKCFGYDDETCDGKGVTFEPNRTAVSTDGATFGWTISSYLCIEHCPDDEE